MSPSRSLASALAFRDAVCRCEHYWNGFYQINVPTDIGAPILGRQLQYIRSPYFVDKHNRKHLQYFSQHLDFVMHALEVGINKGEPQNLLCPEKGFNYCETPCTGSGSFINALTNRLRLLDGNRPWNIEQRHLRGYRAQVDQLFGVLTAIVRKDGTPDKPDWSKRYEKYTGAKREHYRQCALEQAANPLERRKFTDVFHAGMVKWGELSARPRALLIQSVRAQGCDGVKPGTPLRSPIMIEGGYRDHYEEALHHYLHPRGHRFVASGLDLFKRARVISKMIKPGDVVLSCDWSSFDGSLGQLGVEERNSFLRNCENLFGPDPALRRVIDTQNNCTIQSNGVKAFMYGNRGSGTAGTSTGNKIVVLAALRYALGPAARGNNGCKFFCDGDDTLIIVPRQWQQLRPNGTYWWDSWCRRLTALGLETKIEQLLFDRPEGRALPNIRFCRAGIITTSRGLFLCKNPLDALKVMTNYRRHFGNHEFLNYIQTLSVGMTNVYGDVPILHKIGKMFDVGGKVNYDLYEGSGMEHMITLHKSGAPGQINDQHRQSFFETWGVPPDIQLRCEAALDCCAEEFPQLVKRFMQR